MPNAAIVSANKELIRFFELELGICGYTASEHKSCTAVDGDADIIFLDTETINQSITMHKNLPIVYVSSEYLNEEIKGELYLSWPAALSDVRRSLAFALKDREKSPELLNVAVSQSNAVYVIDRERCIVEIAERHIRLSKNEFLLLCELCSVSPQILSRDRIMNLFGAVDGNISDVYICSLRKKLEAPIGKKIIFTHRGRGYRTDIKMLE